MFVQIWFNADIFSEVILFCVSLESYSFLEQLEQ